MFTRVAGGWTGGYAGALAGASIAGAGSQRWPQIAAPEEIITVLLAALSGGTTGALAGREVAETIWEIIYEPGYSQSQ